MISKSLLLLLAFAALAHCQKKLLNCASTWTGQLSDLPVCTTLSAYPEMSKQCEQAEVFGYHVHTYTIDQTDPEICVSVVIRSKEAGGAEETYIYRGPINVFESKTCQEYCDGVIEAKQWFLDNFQTTLTPLYVGCWDKQFLNNENLNAVAVTDGKPTNFVCATRDNYAKEPKDIPNGMGPLSEPKPPEPINLKITVKTEADPNSEYKSIPGWYFIGLAVQALTLFGSLGVLVYTIMLYVDVKKSTAISPDNNFEMK